jgi:hypothetical protein
MTDAKPPQADDPLEQMLEQAFSVELDRLTNPVTAERVLERLRRQALLRAVTLGIVGAFGLLLLVTVGLPALATLPELSALSELVAGRLGALLPAAGALPGSAVSLALLVLLAPFLWAAVDDTV